jgi:hypothetical protein
MKTKFITGLILCGSIFAACDNDDEHGQRVQAGKPTEVTISITNPGTYALTGGEEDGTTEENTVKLVEFFVFNSGGTIDTETGRVGVTEGTGYHSVSVTGDVSSFKETIIMSSGDNKRIVAAINMNLGALNRGDNYNTLRAKLSRDKFIASPNEGYNSRTVPSKGFEMSGDFEVNIKPDKPNSIKIPVSRLVSKVNAPKFHSVKQVNTTVDLSPEEIEQLWGAGATISNITFKGLGYALVNGLDKSSVVFNGNKNNEDYEPMNRTWDTWTWDGKNYLNSSFVTTTIGKYASAYSGKSLSGDFFLNAENEGEKCVYAYENKPKMVTTGSLTGFDPKTVYAFIIKGELVVNGDASNTNGLNKIRYWRINLVMNDNYHIIRNNSYHVYLKSIVSVGHTSEKEAEEEMEVIPPAVSTSNVNVEIEVKQWRINQYETNI